MKKIVLFSLLALALGVSAASAEVDTWSKPGTFTAQVGVGLHWGGLVEVQGGVDLALLQVPLAPTFPLDVGVSGRVAVATNGIGAGAYGTTHLSLKALRTGQSWLNPLELSLAIGVGLLPQIGLDAYGGLAYHLDRSWAIYVEGATFGSVLGASYRF